MTKDMTNTKFTLCFTFLAKSKSSTSIILIFRQQINFKPRIFTDANHVPYFEKSL